MHFILRYLKIPKFVIKPKMVLEFSEKQDNYIYSPHYTDCYLLSYHLVEVINISIFYINYYMTVLFHLSSTLYVFIYCSVH
jgi:hypothetical protein